MPRFCKEDINEEREIPGRQKVVRNGELLNQVSMFNRILHIVYIGNKPEIHRPAEPARRYKNE